jgi:hypothetical protein
MMVVDYRIGVSNLMHRFTDERPRVDPVRRWCSSAAGVGSWRGTMAAHWRWGHGGYGAPFTMGFLPTALEWRGELVSLTLGRGDELYRVGDGGVLHSDLADIEEALRSTSGFKNGMRSLSASTSRSYAGSIAPCGSENRARWLPMVRRVPQLVGKNPSTIGRYL